MCYSGDTNDPCVSDPGPPVCKNFAAQNPSPLPPPPAAAASPPPPARPPPPPSPPPPRPPPPAGLIHCHALLFIVLGILYQWLRRRTAVESSGKAEVEMVHSMTRKACRPLGPFWPGWMLRNKCFLCILLRWGQRWYLAKHETKLLDQRSWHTCVCVRSFPSTAIPTSCELSSFNYDENVSLRSYAIPFPNDSNSYSGLAAFLSIPVLIIAPESLCHFWNVPYVLKSLFISLCQVTELPSIA